MGRSSIVKIREEADPFSMDLGTLAKGDIVKVLEVRRRGGVNGTLLAYHVF